MKKKTFFLLITVSLLLLACSIGYEGLSIGSDEDIDKIYSLTETASAPGYEPITSGDIGIPVNQVDVPEESGAVTAPQTSSTEVNITGDMVEYSVSAANNGCICSTGGNMMIALDIQDDKLFFNLPDGTSLEFVKVGTNTYKRTEMGYYILVDETTKEETRVDEQQHSIITLTEDGFSMGHYQGEEGSPCCTYYYTSVGETP